MFNDRLKLIAEHCGMKYYFNNYTRRGSYDIQNFDPEKFARLIVEDCSTICELASKIDLEKMTEVTDPQHKLMFLSASKQAQELHSGIKKHFGV